jgi:predicted metalloprotease
MRWKGGEQSENLEDRRALGPGTIAGGGGLILLVVLGLLFGMDPQQINQLIGQAQADANPEGNVAGEARELSPEEQEQREFTATVLRYTEVVWSEQFARAGKTYQPPHMVLFTDRVQTGCGVAPSAVGPFYCPVDKTVYLDPSFFEELDSKLGGSKADFSQAYVIAHEVGHHVQNLLGYSQLVDQKRRALPESEFHEWSVRCELQADYLAGVWAHYGQQEFDFIEPGDVDDAITSANAIGDDRLQKRATGFTSPERYTHGTSEQRVHWFTVGLKTGDLELLEEFFKRPYEEPSRSDIYISDRCCIEQAFSGTLPQRTEQLFDSCRWRSIRCNDDEAATVGYPFLSPRR